MTWIGCRRAVVLSLSLVACTEARIQDDEDVLSGVNDRQGEACEEWGDERDCGENDAGLQYCGGPFFEASDAKAWGECLSDPVCSPGETEACGDNGWRSCGLAEGGRPEWNACEIATGEGDTTPLVVVFSGDELAFESAGTATFEIAGECITHDWPTAATPWLAIDLDRSGSIDGGHELFGSGTRLADGTRARHGFVALAELDANGDGVVTPADPRFAELVLWSDHDGDRRSTHWEHESLASRGVVALPVAYTSARECDARGNCAIERAAVRMQTAAMTAEVVDVHLACQ